MSLPRAAHGVGEEGKDDRSLIFLGFKLARGK